MSLAIAENMTNNTQEVQKKILVVEDDFSLRQALEDTLSLAHYAVVTAKNAETALELLTQQNDILMIVSDVNMDNMSGHDLLQHVDFTPEEIHVGYSFRNLAVDRKSNYLYMYAGSRI